MHLSIVFAALVVAAASTGGATAARTAQQPALAIVFHVRPPASNDPALAAADIALRAPEEIGEPLRAMRGHNAARLAFAVCPAYLAALDRAASNVSALAASGEAVPGGSQTGTLLGILARHRPLDATLSQTRAGSRYRTLATAAANELNGDRSVPFTARDLADFAGIDAQVVVAASGFGPVPTEMQSSQSAIAALARADKAVADELKAAVSAGTVELIATPDGEPVLPLLIDAGGKSTADPHTVSIGARADAQWVVNDAIRGVAAFAQRKSSPGFYSPFGAYDDAAGVVVQRGGAAYALFSDRVVRGAGGEGTEAGIDAARGAALHAYALTVSKGVVLPVLFWSEGESSDLQTVSGSDAAMAQRLTLLARDASALVRTAAPNVLVLRIEMQGPWSQRPDARAVVARLVAAVASGRAGVPTTPGMFLHAHPPTAAAYGYPPSAESGSFALWMGSADQASLWNALRAARIAAGGDAAFAKPELRTLIVAAEAGDWYSSVAAPLPGGAVAGRLDDFRTLIASIYRAAGASPPTVIAPVKLGAAVPIPTPTASPSPSP